MVHLIVSAAIPGTKVRCINGKYEWDKEHPVQATELNCPQEGQEYTIRKCVSTQREEGVLLEEVRNGQVFHSRGGWQEPVFALTRFVLV